MNIVVSVIWLRWRIWFFDCLRWCLLWLILKSYRFDFRLFIRLSSRLGLVNKLTELTREEYCGRTSWWSSVIAIIVIKVKIIIVGLLFIITRLEFIACVVDTFRSVYLLHYLFKLVSAKADPSFEFIIRIFCLRYYLWSWRLLKRCLLLLLINFW